MAGCGIKALEMFGTSQDWANLTTKLRSLQKLLAPIESTLQLDSYFRASETVFQNLHKTYKDPKSMRGWWAKILIDCQEYEYGPSGMRKGQVAAYNGWFVEFLTGCSDGLKPKDIASGKSAKYLSCLSSVPMKVEDKLNGVEDMSTLIAGIVGYKVHQDSPNGVTSLQPAHGWVMMLPQNSPLRKATRKTLQN